MKDIFGMHKKQFVFTLGILTLFLGLISPLPRDLRFICLSVTFILLTILTLKETMDKLLSMCVASIMLSTCNFLLRIYGIIITGITIEAILYSIVDITSIGAFYYMYNTRKFFNGLNEVIIREKKRHDDEIERMIKECDQMFRQLLGDEYVEKNR